MPTKNPFDPVAINPFSLRTYSVATRKIASFGLTLFIGGLTLAAIWSREYWALSVLCSSAFMAIGWGLGFLFGVPRVASDDTTSNTNLEQISDWLTKVLVGVGLTQLQKIPTKLGELSHYIAGFYYKSGNDIFALSMVLYFSALGFLTGYLLTRLALQKDFVPEGGEDPRQNIVARPVAPDEAPRGIIVDAEDAKNQPTDGGNKTRDNVAVNKDVDTDRQPAPINAGAASEDK